MSRRTVAITAAVLLTGPLLASCGFDYPTDRVNTNAAGVTDRSGTVKALGMLVVAGQDGIGNLTGSLSNYSEDDDALVGVTGTGDVEVQAVGLPLELGGDGAASSFVNLAALVEDGDPVTLVGDFGAGEIIPLELEFENADPVSVDVPVDKPCDMYEGLEADPDDLPGADDEAPGDESSSGSPAPGQDASDDAALEVEPRAAYDCEAPEAPDHGGEE